MTEAARASLTRYTADRPLALLTDYPPDAAGGGAVILRSLLGPEDRARLVWMSPVPPADAAAAGPNAVALRAGSAGRGRRSVGLDSTVYAGPLAREALAVAEARGARALWVVMYYAGVAIAARLARSGHLPLHLTVHDDPAFGVALRSRRYLALVPWIERDFARALRAASSVDVIGRGMAERYRRRYGVESTIVHRALDEPIASSGDYDAARNGLRVGVLGSTYGYEQLPLLARAVELAAARLSVAPRLLIVGQGHGEELRAEFAGRVEVDFTGHVSEAEGVALLRDCFALYLNYPFGRRDAVLRQASFPTKLSSYVQAARPLLIHAPGDSSVMPLVGPDGYATAWPDLDPAHGADALVAAWGRPEGHASRHEAAERTRREYYDPDRNRRALFGVLDALVPLPEGREGAS
jgi:glycosyltransferase involved in cell wall biosynthesis